MMKIFLIILMLVFGVSADDYDYHSKKHISKELSHLKLSKKQKKEIKKILKEFRYDLKDFRELQEDIEEQREDVFVKERLDIDELNRLNKRLDTKAREIENRLLLKIHKMLDTKQREKFIEYFDDWEVQ